MVVQTCNKCGREKEEYRIYEPSTGEMVDIEVTCPMKYYHG
jgi:hypothetical protein